MRLVKIAVVNVNSTVGAVRSNTDRCIRFAHEAADAEATIAVFPEQVIGGYCPEDLVQWRNFVDSQRAQLERFARETRQLATVFCIGLVVGVGGDIYNVAAVVHRGVILLFSPKEKLPTYNIFYEARTLSRGLPGLNLDAEGVPLADAVLKFDFGLLAVEVCEDLWSPDGPMRRRCYSGAEIVANLSSSPFRAGITGTRHEMIATRAADNQCTLIYANLVGANDGLVFDGGGYVNQNGRPMLVSPRFVAGVHCQVIDLDRTTRSRREATTWRADAEQFRRDSPLVKTIVVTAATADRDELKYPLPFGYQPSTGVGGHVDGGRYPSFFLPPAQSPVRTARNEVLDDFFDALSLGVADYYRKTGAFKKLGVAISGGRDSCLCALIAWRALHLIHHDVAKSELPGRIKDTLSTFYMPTRYSSDATQAAAELLASDLGATFNVMPIEDAFVREYTATEAMLKDDGVGVTELTKQNIQARIRGQRMWNWSNSSGALFLQTGNMSEKAVGYTTMGGDLEGCFSVIANLPKTVVVALLRRLLDRYGFEGIRSTLTTTAGPELAEDQVGEDELMPFAVLDACLHLFAAEKMSPTEVGHALRSLFPDVPGEDLDGWAKKFARLFTRSIFKWVQSPLVVHVGALDLDRERALQLPVVQSTEWSEG